MSRPDRPVDKFGFPIPVTFNELPAPRKGFRLPESPGSRRAIGILVGVIVVGLLAAPWLVRKTRGIMAEVYRNRAQDHFFADDLPGALENMDRAVAWRPDDMELLHERAEFRLANHDLDGALSDANVMLAESKNYAPGYALRSMIHHRRGENAEAIQDATAAINNSPATDPSHWNTRAYYRALAGVELNEALEDIQHALKLDRDEPAFLDTRGYVFYKLGNYAEALLDFNKAIQECESVQKEFEEQMAQTINPLEIKFFERRIKLLNENLAVMYHHRGETQQQLGNSQEAKDDSEVARKLGYDPDKGIE